MREIYVFIISSEKKVKESAQVGTNEKGQFLGDRVVLEIFKLIKQLSVFLCDMKNDAGPARHYLTLLSACRLTPTLHIDLHYLSHHTQLHSRITLNHYISTATKFILGI